MRFLCGYDTVAEARKAGELRVIPHANVRCYRDGAGVLQVEKVLQVLTVMFSLLAF